MNKRIGIPGAIVQLTEAEREILARKNAEQNKRSERDVQARGGRR
ncbi:hypothetical protein QFW82_20765 [Streptomyces malaysiensis subsp. malaysiensis]|nr:hypothetical protein [Streptomyces sp. NA07423]WHX19313.1 hypothetical protein QFW82_20765 [Streptomyces sp. NA07423]